MTPAIRSLLATPAIHRQIGCSETTVSRWRAGQRRPDAGWAPALIALAPELADDIRAWCADVADEPTKMIAFRAPVSVAKGIERLKREGDTATDVILDSIVAELARRERVRREQAAQRRDDFEERIDTRHHADDCRTDGGAVDFGCPRCAAKVGVTLTLTEAEALACVMDSPAPPALAATIARIHDPDRVPPSVVWGTPTPSTKP